MLSTVLGLLSGFLSLVGKLSGLWQTYEEKKAGEDAATVAGDQEVSSDVEKAIQAGNDAASDFDAHGVPVDDPQARH
jgi:hypothetical protein